jgi:ATP-dependent DNA helicase RecQ
LPARAILLYNATDEPKLHKRVKDTFPEKDYIRKVYEHLAYYYQIATGDGYGVTREFNIDDFCHKFKHFPVPVHSSLQILQRAGYIEYLEEQDNQARVKFIVTRDDLYRLRGDTPHEEKVIVALLRNYGGLFADYGFVDESMIAHQCGLKPNDVYQTLKLLSEKHVIQFIPRKQVPYVRYLQRREDSEHVMLPPAVYEERLAQYQERIEAMLHYAKDDSKCRSRQLLEYFGEKNVRDCGMCDVCHNASKAVIQQVQQQILRLLADRKQHHLTELYRLQLPKEELDQALAYLLKEEYIIQQDGYLLIP